MVRTFISDLRKEFAGYNSSRFTKDVMAGLTVTAVALPLALAFGVGSGVDAASGLITAIIAGLVIGALSGGYYQISGPTGAMAAILISVTARYQLQGIFIATLMAGALLLLSGIFRLGRIAAFLPTPVVTGFTSGIATIIALGQVDNFFGVTSSGTSVLERIISYWTAGSFTPDLTAVGIGTFVILFMAFYPKNSLIPSSLLSIIITTAAAILLKLDVAVVGEIPKTLFPDQRLILADITLAEVTTLVPAAFSIAMLGMIESLLCGASAGRMTGVRLRNDQELLAQGVGNMILPFFGGIPATAAIARTSVAIKSGAQTRLAGIIHALGLLAAMFLLAPVMSQIPLASLAGVLAVTAWRMNDWSFIKYIFTHRFKGPIAKFLATMLSTIIFDLTIAILIGVILSLVLLIVNLAQLEVNYEKVDMKRIKCTDPKLLERYSNAMVTYITGPIIFANIERVESIIENLKGSDTLFLSMRGVSLIDVSGAQALMDLLQKLRAAKIDVALCGLPTRAMKMMHRSDIYEFLGEKNFYWSVERALLDLRPRP